MKYFKNDGIYIDDKNLTIAKLGKAISKYCKVHKISKILIGKTNFSSNDYVFSALAQEVLKNDIQIDDIGISTSPCVAYLTHKFTYQLGLILCETNECDCVEIKFFNPLGEIANENFEIEIENLLNKNFQLKSSTCSQIHNQERLKNFYIQEIKKLIKFDIPIVIDCNTQKNQSLIHKIFPNKEKIHNPHTNNFDLLKSVCQKKHLIGVAVSSDASRLTLITESGKVLNGNDILLILSKFFLRAGDTLVGTQSASEFLVNFIKDKKINFVSTNECEKDIITEMKKHNCNLGGNASGNIILKTYTNSADAILVSIIILNILSLSKTSLDDLLNSFKTY